jgi:hypothetical protein
MQKRKKQQTGKNSQERRDVRRAKRQEETYCERKSEQNGKRTKGRKNTRKTKEEEKAEGEKRQKTEEGYIFKRSVAAFVPFSNLKV